MGKRSRSCHGEGDVRRSWFRIGCGGSAGCGELHAREVWSRDKGLRGRLDARPAARVHFGVTLKGEVVGGVCWVPVPSSSRRYYLEPTVYDGKAEVQSKDWSRFL
jgi:hypothetical protein